LKEWRFRPGADIPLDRPFKTSETGLSSSDVLRLKNEGLLESVDKVNASPRGSYRVNIWKATPKLIERVEESEAKKDQTISSRTLHSMEPPGQTAEMRALLVQHEVANVGYRLVRARRTPRDKNLYMADIGVEIGHAIVQLEMLAIDLGLSPEACKSLGLKTTLERFKEFWPDKEVGQRCRG